MPHGVYRWRIKTRESTLCIVKPGRTDASVPASRKSTGRSISFYVEATRRLPAEARWGETSWSEPSWAEPRRGETRWDETKRGEARPRSVGISTEPSLQRISAALSRFEVLSLSRPLSLSRSPFFFFFARLRLSLKLVPFPPSPSSTPTPRA